MCKENVGSMLDRVQHDKKTRLYFLVILCIFLFHGIQVRAAIFGSDTAASRQRALLTFSGTTNNEMRGFTSVEGGFTLTNLLTTCTFNALLPVSNDITFNGGNLFLSEDLIFTNTMRFINSGSIRGNSRTVQFPETSTDMTVPVSSGVIVFDGANIELNSNIILGGLWRIRGVCKIFGNGKKLVLGPGNFVLELGNKAQLEIQDTFITGLGSSNLRCLTSNGTITICDSALELDRDFTFSMGALIIEDDVAITGTSVFNYQSATASTILSNSTLYLKDGVTFNYAPVAANKNLIVMTDATSGLYLDGASIVSTTTGLRLSTGTLYIDNAVTFSSQALNSGQAMELSSDLNIQTLAGAVLDVFGFVKYE